MERIMNQSHTVKILVLDEDKSFVESFSKEIKKCSRGAKCEVFSSLNDSKHYDLYICSLTNDLTSNIEDILKKDRSAPIFLSLTNCHKNTLKKLITKNISGIINKINLDISPILEEIRKIDETYAKVGSLVQKLNSLKTLREAV